jgi:hypothetical protein
LQLKNEGMRAVVYNRIANCFYLTTPSSISFHPGLQAMYNRTASPTYLPPSIPFPPDLAYLPFEMYL